MAKEGLKPDPYKNGVPPRPRMVGLPDRFERNLASHGLGFKGLKSLGSESMQQDFHRIYHVSPSYGPRLRAYLFSLLKGSSPLKFFP